MTYMQWEPQETWNMITNRRLRLNMLFEVIIEKNENMASRTNKDELCVINTKSNVH